MFAVRRGVQTELNREIRCLDNRPNISAHLFHPHNTVPGHRLEGTGKVAAAPSCRHFQLLERFGLTIQDGLQEQLVFVAEDLRHGLHRFKPDLGFIGPWTIFPAGDGQGSLLKRPSVDRGLSPSPPGWRSKSAISPLRRVG